MFDEHVIKKAHFGIFLQTRENLKIWTGQILVEKIVK